jgi:hypothetical protein
MNRVLADIFALWKSNRAYDPGFVVSQYINASDKIACSVAVTGQATVRGFQSLKLAGPNNPYGVTPGWGALAPMWRVMSPKTAMAGGCLTQP